MMRADLVYQTVSLMDRLCLYTDVKTFHHIYDVLVGAFDVGYQEAIDDLDEDIEIEIVEESPLDQYRDEDLFEGRTSDDLDQEDAEGYHEWQTDENWSVHKSDYQPDDTILGRLV